MYIYNSMCKAVICVECLSFLILYIFWRNFQHFKVCHYTQTPMDTRWYCSSIITSSYLSATSLMCIDHFHLSQLPSMTLSVHHLHRCIIYSMYKVVCNYAIQFSIQCRSGHFNLCVYSYDRSVF